MTYKWKMLVADLVIAIATAYAIFDSWDKKIPAVMLIMFLVWHDVRMVHDFRKRTREENESICREVQDS